MVKIQGHEYEMTYDVKDGKAVNGRFKDMDLATLLELCTDAIAQYGKDVKLHEVTRKLCDSIKLYQVTINETSSIDYTYEVYAFGEVDAMDEVITGKGDLLYKHEVDTDTECVKCVLVCKETDDVDA
jgi:hypothetical protein